MQVNFKFGLKNEEKTKMRLISAVGFFWQKIYKFIFSIFFVILAVTGGYVWQKSMSGSEWSNEKKQAYLNAQNKGVIFDEDAFNKALSDIDARKNENVNGNQLIRDIFKSY